MPLSRLGAARVNAVHHLRVWAWLFPQWSTDGQEPLMRCWLMCNASGMICAGASAEGAERRS